MAVFRVHNQRKDRYGETRGKTPTQVRRIRQTLEQLHTQWRGASAVGASMGISRGLEEEMLMEKEKREGGPRRTQAGPKVAGCRAGNGCKGSKEHRLRDDWGRHGS